jgi:hypothetical protein
MMSQKDAVYQAITNAFKEADIDFESGTDVAYDLMDKNIRLEVMNTLIGQFRTGAIKLEKNFGDDKLKNYVGTLINNWMKKDTRLNGDATFSIKNPGSRVGQTDPLIKELRKMLKATKGTQAEAEVKIQIRKRQEALRDDMIKNININVTILPPELRAFV